jgi:hypothetical protein
MASVIGVDHRRRRADGPGLAAALDAQRVQGRRRAAMVEREGRNIAARGMQ